MLMSTLLFILAMISAMPFGSHHQDQTIEKNGMSVHLQRDSEYLTITMTAPTDGWVTIGFNESVDITGAYLLMGRVRGTIAEVVEYTTISPGNYKPISSLGAQVRVKNVRGRQTQGYTSLTFSLPINMQGEFQKSLEKGTEYVLIMAYSTSDDFDHHSIMRTSIHMAL